ncbi:MAG: ATP-dependent metallopeptidase FtsH/Yme1/Tma family protein [Flavonifractor plautii]
MTAIVSILLWALVLTLLVNLATSRLQQANSVEVSYGQFRQLIMQDAVESVVMSSGKYTFTLKEGYSLCRRGRRGDRPHAGGGRAGQSGRSDAPGEQDHRRSAGPAPVGRDSPQQAAGSEPESGPERRRQGVPGLLLRPPD